MKVRTELKELMDADVRFISLVDRAATRMPFRVLKREGDGMIDLSKLSEVFKRDREAPTVSAVVVFAQKDEAAAKKVEDAVKAAGFSVDKAVKNDDGETLSYMQVDGDLPKDASLVRLSENMVAVVKGFQPNHPGLGDEDFGSSASSNSFFQGVDASLDVLFNKICSALQAATDEGEAATKIGAQIDGFKKYVVGLVKALPTAAFKADIAIREALMNTTQKADSPSIEELLSKSPSNEISQEDWGKMGTYDKLSWVLASYNKANGNGAQAGGGDDGKPGISVEKKEHPAGCMCAPCVEKVQKSEHVAGCQCGNCPAKKADEPAAAVEAAKDETSAKKLDAILEGISKLGERVEKIEKNQSENKEAIDDIAKKNEDVSNKLKNIVLAPPANGDNPTGGTTVKKVDDPRSGCFDTAMMRNRGRGR